MLSHTLKLIKEKCPACRAMGEQYTADWEFMCKGFHEKLAQKDAAISRLARREMLLMSWFDEYLESPDMEDEFMANVSCSDDDRRVENVLVEKRKRDKKRITDLEKEVEKLRAALELERKKNLAKTS